MEIEERVEMREKELEGFTGSRYGKAVRGNALM
jgi:hypothetical protein